MEMLLKKEIGAAKAMACTTDAALIRGADIFESYQTVTFTSKAHTHLFQTVGA